MASQDDAERAVVDHLRPHLAPLDDFARVVEIGAFTCFTCLRQRGCPLITGSVPGLRDSSSVQ